MGQKESVMAYSRLVAPGGKPTVKIKLCRRPDKSLYWEVNVRSNVKPGLMNRGIREWHRETQIREIGILAAALAEGFCEKYADTLDPDEVYHEAEKVYETIRKRNPKVFGAGLGGLASSTVLR